MRGIDVIEALQNIDENLIFRAKHHKKYAPAWLRYVSVAACICCALLLGLLIINRLIAPGEENVPDVLAPPEEFETSAPEAETEPSVSFAEDNSSLTDNVSDFETELFSFGSSYAIEENRINNLKLACDSINGTVLQPGDTFSFNDTLGERTAGKGYKVSTVSATGDDEPVLGGGISQVSSTLYFCCLYSDLEILERHGHVFQPSWTSAGRDAAVYWNSQDFRFRNSTAYPIRIDASLSDGRVYIALMSTADDEKYVEIDTSSTTTEDQITYYLTRHIYDMDGNLIRTDTTEQLDAMGGLGTTIYALWQDATEATEVPEHPDYVIMEDDLVFGQGVTLCMTPSEVISVFGAPITDEIYGENDMYRMLDYDNALFFFEYCEACGAYQIIECRADAEGAPSMPLGLSIGMSLPEALARFDAEDAQRGQPTTLYYYDDLHWALYQSIYGSDLVYIQLRVGADCSYQINFNRSDQIYSISFSFSSGGLICPYAS